MGTITLTASRGYQDIGTVGQTVAQLAGNVQSINQILDVGLRNTRDYQNSWIRVSDLIGLGLATLINGNQLTSSGAGAGGTTLTASDSVVITANNITLVNDSAAPGNSYFYGTNSGGTLGWYAQSTITGTTYTASESITLTGNNFTLTGDSASPGNSYFYGTSGAGTRGWYALSTLPQGTVTSIGSTTLTIAGTSAVPTVNLSGTQVTNIGLGGTSIQPGNIQNMESAQWNSTSGPVLLSLTVPQDILIPYNCTLREVDILTQGGSGSCTVTILRSAAIAGAIGTQPPSVDITNGHSPQITTSATPYTNTTFTGWTTTTLTQNDVLRLTLTANTTFTSVKIILRMY